MTTVLNGTLSVLGVLAALIWIRQLMAMVRRRHRITVLDDQADAEPPGGWPRLAVVVAARNEADHVGPAMRSLLTSGWWSAPGGRAPYAPAESPRCA